MPSPEVVHTLRELLHWTGEGKWMSDDRLPAPDDWRRQGQETYLAGAKLVKQAYRAYRQGWEHDHCELCWANFSLEPGDVNAGYSTKDCYRWICPDCYEDFRHEFSWVVDTSGA